MTEVSLAGSEDSFSVLVAELVHDHLDAVSVAIQFLQLDIKAGLQFQVLVQIHKSKKLVVPQRLEHLPRKLKELLKYPASAKLGVQHETHTLVLDHVMRHLSFYTAQAVT